VVRLYDCDTYLNTQINDDKLNYVIILFVAVVVLLKMLTDMINYDSLLLAICWRVWLITIAYCW